MMSEYVKKNIYLVDVATNKGVLKEIVSAPSITDAEQAIIDFYKTKLKHTHINTDLIQFSNWVVYDGYIQ